MSEQANWKGAELNTWRGFSFWPSVQSKFALIPFLNSPTSFCSWELPIFGHHHDSLTRPLPPTLHVFLLLALTPTVGSSLSLVRSRSTTGSSSSSSTDYTASILSCAPVASIRSDPALPQRAIAHRTTRPPTTRPPGAGRRVSPEHGARSCHER
jgi:hypothetical protein